MLNCCTQPVRYIEVKLLYKTCEENWGSVVIYKTCEVYEIKLSYKTCVVCWSSIVVQNLYGILKFNCCTNPVVIEVQLLYKTCEVFWSSIVVQNLCGILKFNCYTKPVWYIEVQYCCTDLWGTLSLWLPYDVRIHWIFLGIYCILTYFFVFVLLQGHE